MLYTLIDLLQKLKEIEKSAVQMYLNMAESCRANNARLSIVCKILATEESRHVEFYEKLIADAMEQEDIGIDFDIYDKASSLMTEFKKRISVPDIKSVQDLLIYAYEMEESNTALLLDIRGRMIKDKLDSTNFNYLALTEIILEEQKHVVSLKTFKK